jgi:hypothetical protein
MFKAQPVIQCTTSGEFVATFKSLCYAEAKTKISRQEIADVLKNKRPFDSKGFTWLYLNEETKHRIKTK